VRQGFVEHFQNLNPKPTIVENHGYIELEDLYQERVKLLDKLKEHICRKNIMEMKVQTITILEFLT
jgi:hypothetical protein